MQEDAGVKRVDAFWEPLVLEATGLCGTPCYVFAMQPVLEALGELGQLASGLPVRNWLSFKTQPLPHLLRAWRSLGHGVEVVSAFELKAALAEGYAGDQIIVNGVAKHSWLCDIDSQGLRVHFDSLREVEQLRHAAVANRWRTGVRIHVGEEYDPDEPQYGGQFGLRPEEAPKAVAMLRDVDLQVESVHFHLRANVREASAYGAALREASQVCRIAGIEPRFVDCGGGLPAEGEYPLTASAPLPVFGLADLRTILSGVSELFPSCVEIWLENGRFLTSRSGVLVVTVLDVKERSDCRYLICDGGRTNHAIVSDWERHKVFTVPAREGRTCFTTVCGPTCMAFDRLCRQDLPSDLAPGDRVVWMNAGAYHMPWETRFSQGLAAVAWVSSDGRMSIARDREAFRQWWERWNR